MIGCAHDDAVNHRDTLRPMKTGRLSLAVILVLGAVAAPGGEPSDRGNQEKTKPRPMVRFDITVPPGVHDRPITGRVYVMITRSEAREPRLQLNQADGIPFFGRDVEGWLPGAPATIDDRDLGFPVNSLHDIPPGEYFVQAFVNIYSEFKRADGHVLWMHDDQWEGQQWHQAPGNLYSRPRKITLDGSAGYRIALVADQTIPPVVVPPDTAWVKRIKFQSPMLSKFWGRPIFLGATVLLPRDYDREAISYPVVYMQGHFGLNAPLGFREGSDIVREWNQDNFPRMLVVSFQHPNPYYDDSYAVNSVNVGPYGDAIMQELIPVVEKRFRAIREPYARLLAGGSTGGWEALALQLFHPDFFGGTWCYCPDPVTFSGYEGVDIYKDENAFYKQHEWYRVPTPNMRDTFGEPLNTVQQKNQFELVNGTKGRSGRQMDIWSAVFGPLGRDGYFDPLIDQRTGTINKRVAQYLERQLRPARVHEAELVRSRTKNHRQAARLHRRHGHLPARQGRHPDGAVDEDDGQPTLRGVLHVRRSQAALLERARNTVRAPETDGRFYPRTQARRRHDAVVEILSVRGHARQGHPQRRAMRLPGLSCRLAAICPSCLALFRQRRALCSWLYRWRTWFSRGSSRQLPLSSASGASRRNVKRSRGWPRTGPPRSPRRRHTRDKCSWRRGRVGLFADRTRFRRLTFRAYASLVAPPWTFLRRVASVEDAAQPPERDDRG